MVPNQLNVNSMGYTPGVDGGPGTFTFQISTAVSNFGSADVDRRSPTGTLVLRRVPREVADGGGRALAAS